MISLASQKDALRQRMLSRRNGLPPEIREDVSLQICTAILQTVAVGPDDIIAGYSAIRSEVNIMPVLRDFCARGITCALPQVVGRDVSLVFRQWDEKTGMIKGAMGILEPDFRSPEVFPDIVLVPLLAFDERGNRLGYGAGHYDTTFSKRKALMIGVGFEVQKINDVPAESHDVKMDIVITEKGVYRT